MSPSEAAIREALADATPGQWFTVDPPWGKSDFVVAGHPDPHLGKYVCDTENFDGREDDNAVNDAAYIAACNPAAIRSLLSELDALRLELENSKATEASLRARCEADEALLVEARDGLAGGLWDYGPGQDEHDTCEALVEKIDAAMSQEK